MNSGLDRSPIIPQNDGLLVRARAGDREAENALFERLQARVLQLAKKRIWDEQAALDITQETLATAFEKFREADLSHGLLPWVFKIFHYKVGNYLKKRRAEAAHGASPEVLERMAASGGAREATAVIELEDAIGKALQRLSPECRQIFRLLLADADGEEMRKAFGGEPIGTTYSRVSRCRERLLREVEALTKEREV